MKKSMLFEAVVVLLVLFLAFLLYVMVATGGQKGPGQWTLSGLTVPQGSWRAMFMGPSDELYVLSDGYINAVSPEGKVMWRAGIPDDLGTCDRTWWSKQEAFDGDTMCLLLAPEELQVPPCQELVVLGASGKLLWSMPLAADTLPNGQPNNYIIARGGMIYLQSGSGVTAYDRRGVPIWKLNGIYYQPSAGEDGTLYVIPGGYGLDKVEAYGRDGALKWSYTLENDTSPPRDTRQSQAELLYSDHNVYLQRGRDLVALNEDGGLRWKKKFNASRIYMSLGRDGVWSVMMNCVNGIQVDKYDAFITLVHPDGSESAPPANRINLPNNVMTSAGGYGIDYFCLIDTSAGDGSPGDLLPMQVDAYDTASGKKMWSYTIRPEMAANTTLNESTARNVMYDETENKFPVNVIEMNRLTPEAWYEQNAYPPGHMEVRKRYDLRLIPWEGGLYVSYWAYNYEYPFFFDKSRCVYGGGLYAFARNGTLLWEAPTSSDIDHILFNNSTVYYSTRDGKLSAWSDNAVTGLALTAVFYIFIRFLLAGAVTRARGLVDKNENRARVLSYISANPGASLYDVSRDLGLNMGTARYHLMILGVNHRIVSFKADEKYVRYFTNAGSYSREQQLIVSMMRRDGVRRALSMLLERPGLSNAELSREVGMQESAASRLKKELVEKGVVLKEQAGEGRLSYSIKSEYRGPVTFAVERLNGS